MKQKTPPVDIRKVLRAAAEAALEEPPPVTPRKRRLSTGRALLLGAGAVTAGRVLARRGGGLLPSLQGRLADLAARPDADVDEPELDAEEDVEALEEEPDVEPEDELDEEPQSDGGEPEQRPRQRAGRGRS